VGTPKQRIYGLPAGAQDVFFLRGLGFIASVRRVVSFGRRVLFWKSDLHGETIHQTDANDLQGHFLTRGEEE
jgi:hypothetical protein